VQVSRASVAALLAFALGTTVVSVLGVAVRVTTPSSGTALLAAATAFQPDGVAVDPLPGATTALRHGDVVTAIAGRQVLEWADTVVDPGGERLPTTLGQVVPFEVRRSGALSAVDVRLVAYPTTDVLATAWGTLLFVLAFLAMAVIVFLPRPRVPAAGALLLAAIGAAGSAFPFLMGQDPLEVDRSRFGPGAPRTLATYRSATSVVTEG
jgi:hypothetical protein